MYTPKIDIRGVCSLGYYLLSSEYLLVYSLLDIQPTITIIRLVLHWGLK